PKPVEDQQDDARLDRRGGPGGRSSPLSGAKRTSCGSSLARGRLRRSGPRVERQRASALLGAGDAEAGGRNGFEPLRSNFLAAALALAVRAAIDAAEGRLDVVQVLDQALDEREHLGPLAGRLRGIGEALVQGDADGAVGLRAQL